MLIVYALQELIRSAIESEKPYIDYLVEGLDMVADIESDSLKGVMLVGAVLHEHHIGNNHAAAELMGLLLEHPAIDIEKRQLLDMVRPDIEAALDEAEFKRLMEAGYTLSLEDAVSKAREKL